MPSQSFKVGELAARTGVSVRTLHHYDELGLLVPSRRSPSGHRLYGEADVARLLRIRALVQLGVPLAEIGASLGRPGFEPEQLLLRQLERLRQVIADAGRLQQRLESLLARVRGGEVTAGEFLETIEAMSMFEKHYTKEQLQQLAARRQALGEDTIRAVEAEWPQLIDKVRAEMAKGTDPKAPAVRPLAQRWKELLAMFTGGDAGIQAAAANVYASEPKARAMHGLDLALCEYIGRALAD